MDYGLFTMPSHPPERNLYDGHRWDLQQLRWADELGFSEAWIGEHHTAPWEPHPAPDLLVAQALMETSRMRIGPGGFLLPYHHPAELAHRVAMLDHLAQGRLNFGVAASGLPSDWAMFNVDGEKGANREMTREALDIILKLWAQDPPYRIDGKFWKIALEKHVYPEYKVGWVPRPYQQPHPPIAISLLTPHSNSAKTAGERGFIPVSGNFFHRRYLRGHWEKYVEGCEAAGRRPDPDVWRVSRSVLVTETEAEAEDYLADPENGLSFYYKFFHFSFSQLRKALFMVKADLDMPDEAVTVDNIKRGMIIAGSPRHVLDQLVALRDEVGHFGTLLMAGHDWDQPKLWRRSMELLTDDVMPSFVRHAAATPPKR